MTASLRGTKHKEYYDVQATIAKLYQNAGRYEEAEKIYIENAALGKTLFGEKDPNYALSLLDLGDVAYYTGRYEDALSFYKQAQKIYELDTKANAHYYAICLVHRSVNKSYILMWQKTRCFSFGFPSPLERTVLTSACCEAEQLYDKFK